jgi:hypothetical protein
MNSKTVDDIGCCGAFCGSCKVKSENLCIGCKAGYKEGERALSKAKCKMKVCCIGKCFQTCADCNEVIECKVIQEFYNKNGYKYKKYKEAIYYIIENGYSEFLKQSRNQV